MFRAMPKREKLNIRLPTDQGPNPYDSNTDPKLLTPRWLRDWRWWAGLIVLAVIAVAIQRLNGQL
jgi:hypothetical protein